MIAEKSLFATVLKNNGYSVTRQRQTVFSVIARGESHTMADLTKKLSGLVDRASVYRCIELFEKLGIVHRVQIGWKYRLELSEMFREHHHHATCTNCGQLFPISGNAQLEELIGRLHTPPGFKALSHMLEIRGLCVNCQT